MFWGLSCADQPSQILYTNLYYHPLIKNPNNDNVMVGGFVFKNFNVYKKSLDSLFKKKLKVNNEYYLDMALSETINLGFEVGEIVVNKFINWGTPEAVNDSIDENLKIFS